MTLVSSLSGAMGDRGRSSLAYEFARAVRDSAPSNLHAVVWLSAKVREYVEGETRDRLADFFDVESFGTALWSALYDADPSIEQATREGIVRELAETPVLLALIVHGVGVCGGARPRKSLSDVG